MHTTSWTCPWGRSLEEYQDMFQLSKEDLKSKILGCGDGPSSFNLQFHIDSLLEMCRVSKNEVKIFPLLDLKNQKSEYLEPILNALKDKGFETKIIKTDYEF